VPTVLGRHAKCLQLHNNGKDQREVPVPLPFPFHTPSIPLPYPFHTPSIPLPPVHLVLCHAHSFVRSFEMCQMATWQTSATDKATDTKTPHRTTRNPLKTTRKPPGTHSLPTQPSTVIQSSGWRSVAYFPALLHCKIRSSSNGFLQNILKGNHILRYNVCHIINLCHKYLAQR